MYTRNIFPKFNSAVLFQKKNAAAAASVQQEQATYSAEDEAFHYAGLPHPRQFTTTQDGIGQSATPASGSAILFLSVASAFMMLGLLATTFFYYHKKRSAGSSWLRSSHKVLLLSSLNNQNQKDGSHPHQGAIIPLQEKSFLISSYNGSSQPSSGQPQGGPGTRTKAVRSPSSGQVNPFASSKKSPSPTGTAAFPASSGTHDEPTSGKSEINNSNSSDHQHNGKLAGNRKILSSLENLSEASNKDPLQDSGISTTTGNKKGSVDSGVVPNLGKLHFKLKYSYEKRALCLVIIRASDLPGAKDGVAHHGSMDPYVKMQLLPEKQHKAKTRVLRKTQNPVYNEEFTFYGVTPNLLESLVVHFVVLNFDRFSRDEILGEVVCKLNQFEFDSLEKQITLVRDIAPRGNKLKIQELGELLVSLCYQPIANRLTVVILKARNLPKMDLTGLCDPYVKLYVFHNNARIFKKRTHVKKRTLSPVFNESFVFDIPPEEGLDNIQMQLLVYDHDRVTRNELIGKIELSCSTPGCPATEKHWNEVIKSPRRQIAEWHKLKEC